MESSNNRVMFTVVTANRRIENHLLKCDACRYGMACPKLDQLKANLKKAADWRKRQDAKS